MIKTFYLGAKKYTVEITKGNRTSNQGIALAPMGKIVVHDSWDGQEVPEDSMEQVFFHELVHCIFTDAGRDDLSTEEAFVQNVGALMHQFFKTAVTGALRSKETVSLEGMIAHTRHVLLRGPDGYDLPYYETCLGYLEELLEKREAIKKLME